MRQELENKEGERFRIIAIVKRYGSTIINRNLLIETILLADVRDATTNEFLSDHIWFKVNKHFIKLNAQTGDTLAFDARVMCYQKDIVFDFTFKRPSQMEIIKSDRALFPDETNRTLGSGKRNAIARKTRPLTIGEYRGQLITKIRQAMNSGQIQLDYRFSIKHGFDALTIDDLEEICDQIDRFNH